MKGVWIWDIRIRNPLYVKWVRILKLSLLSEKASIRIRLMAWVQLRKFIPMGHIMHICNSVSSLHAGASLLIIAKPLKIAEIMQMNIFSWTLTEAYRHIHSNCRYLHYVSSIPAHQQTLFLLRLGKEKISPEVVQHRLTIILRNLNDSVFAQVFDVER